MPGASTNGIGASVRTAATDKSEPNPGEWMTYPSTSREEGGHIHAGTFEKNTGIKLSENPDKMIHPMGVLLGPRHAKGAIPNKKAAKKSNKQIDLKDLKPWELTMFHGINLH